MTQLSIGITAHSEGVVLHKTLLSVLGAVEPLVKKGISFEILLSLDNPTEETIDYSSRIPSLFPTLTIRKFTTSYGNPGQARNNIVSKASGQYITFLDGDDLVSSNWLIDAVQFLITHDNDANLYVAHPEAVVEFGNDHSLVLRHGEIDRTSDSLLSVYANRWNVVIMIKKQFLVDHPYPHGQGYGFEDWYINCLTIYNGYHNTLIPHTSLFVRRKSSHSMWLEHKNNAVVLPRNPLLTFSYVKGLISPFAEPNNRNLNNNVKVKIKKVVKNNQQLLRAARIAKKLVMKRQADTYRIPQWIKEEFVNQHYIDKSIFFSHAPSVYDSITPEHRQAAIGYKEISDSLTHDVYDYILFVPWLIKGGADLFAINYANGIARADPNKHVLVVATTPHASPWKGRLDRSIDFLDFGIITKFYVPSVIQRLLEHLVENSRAQYLHIINSELAYDFIETHSAYIKATNKKLTVTSFSQSTDESGRVFGYSHTHVPRVYDLIDTITTDNNAVKGMWVREYGFDPQKILVHRQPVVTPQFVKDTIHSPIRVLWAARLSPEKQPHIIKDVALQLKSSPVHIDMYGHADTGFDISFLQNLPDNLTYHGSFDGFSTINPELYDIYLYTSLFDGMPNSVLEAASYKLAIVASSVGGIPELIDDGINGVLIEDTKNAALYADAIKKLIDNPAKITKFGEAIHGKIEEQFSEKSYHKEIMKMLKKIGYSDDKKS
jgi:glycosyltransferase involved in cell wall biosynthesis